MDNMQRVKNVRVLGPKEDVFNHIPSLTAQGSMWMRRWRDYKMVDVTREKGFSKHNRADAHTDSQAVKVCIRPAQDLKWRRAVCTKSHL